jgi:hypothetical protein
MRESEKNKWLQFNSKTNKKSIVKQQSIFQSPVGATGRVGVGTLGTSTAAKTEEASVLIKRNIQTNQTKYFIKNTSGSKKAL